MRLSAEEFEILVQEALELIPDEFRPYLRNVPVLVEDEPSDQLLDAMGVPPDETLYGLYTGLSLAQRGYDESGLPPRITVFRRPHLRAAWDLEDLRREVARTIIHEVAHHFGIGEERLEELGWG
ncbi:MAG: metallopeptidase family protein [Holophaga sp.]